MTDGMRDSPKSDGVMRDRRRDAECKEVNYTLQTLHRGTATLTRRNRDNIPIRAGWCD